MTHNMTVVSGSDYIATAVACAVRATAAVSLLGLNVLVLTRSRVNGVRFMSDLRAALPMQEIVSLTSSSCHLQNGACVRVAYKTEDLRGCSTNLLLIVDASAVLQKHAHFVASFIDACNTPIACFTRQPNDALAELLHATSVHLE